MSGGIAGSVRIFRVDLAALGDALEAVERKTPRLSAADQRRSLALSGDGRAQRHWRAARIATRLLLEEAADIPRVRQVDFTVSANGRPGLAAEPPYFSISHSGSVALVAISLCAPIGVDIELERSVDIREPRRGRIVAAGLRLGGAGTATATASDTSDAAVLRAWVRLEAVAKALGCGIGRLLAAEGLKPGATDVNYSAGAGVIVRNLDLAEEYAAVASRDLPEAVTVETFQPTHMA